MDYFICFLSTWVYLDGHSHRFWIPVMIYCLVNICFSSDSKSVYIMCNLIFFYWRYDHNFFVIIIFGFCRHLRFIIVRLETTVWLVVTFRLLLGNGFHSDFFWSSALVFLCTFRRHDTMNICAFIYLPRHVSAVYYGHHQVVSQLRDRKRSELGGCPLTNDEYKTFICQLLFPTVV